MSSPSQPAEDRPKSRVAPRRTRLQAARHTRAFRWIDPRFTHRWQIYVRQSAMAAVLLGLILLAEDVIANGVIVAAIASSVAVVFFVPHSVASSPFRIVGGHLSGVAAAYIVIGAGLLIPAAASDAGWFVDISGAVALGLVVLLMSITNTEHAPAAGTALGLAVQEVPGDSVLFIVTAAVLVAAARVILGSRLHNLI